MQYYTLNVYVLNWMESKMLEEHIMEQMQAEQIEFEEEASNLTLEDYQIEAMDYRKPSADSVYALLNLAAETGELLGKVAKHIRDAPKDAARDPDYAEVYVDGIASELGDILWMCAAIADDMELSLGQVALANLTKLEDRRQRNKISGSGDNR